MAEASGQPHASGPEPARCPGTAPRPSDIPDGCLLSPGLWPEPTFSGSGQGASQGVWSSAAAAAAAQPLGAPAPALSAAAAPPQSTWRPATPRPQRHKSGTPASLQCLLLCSLVPPTGWSGDTEPQIRLKAREQATKQIQTLVELRQSQERTSSATCLKN